LAQSVAVVTRATQTLQRELERRRNDDGRDGSPSRPEGGRDGSPSRPDATDNDGRLGEASLPGDGRPGGPSLPETFATGAIDSYKYVGFEDRFRGSPEAIR